jgi:hypothetical protein
MNVTNILLPLFLAAALLAESSFAADYYEIIGVKRDANAYEIARAYKSRVKEIHPDKFSTYSKDIVEAQTRELQNLNEAFALLSDPKAKQVYDGAGFALKFSELHPNAYNSILDLSVNGSAGSGIIIANNNDGESIVITAAHVLGRLSGLNKFPISEAVITAGGKVVGTDRAFEEMMFAKPDGINMQLGIPFFRPNPEFHAEKSDLNFLKPSSDIAAAFLAAPGVKSKSVIEKSPSNFIPALKVATPQLNGTVALVGVKGWGQNRRRVVNSGRVLTPEEASELLLDSTGKRVPFDSNTEFVIQGDAFKDPNSFKGVSGGGVFDQYGNLVGVIVRVGTDSAGTAYVRAVKVTYLMESMKRAQFSSQTHAMADLVQNIPFYRITNCSRLLVN